jgi:hypothetical protein
MKIKINIKQIFKFEFFPLIFIIILIFCNAVGMLSYYSSSEVLKENIIQSMVWRTEDSANLISQQIDEFKVIIQGVAFRTKIQSMDWDIQKTALLAEAKRLNIKRFHRSRSQQLLTPLQLIGRSSSTRSRSAGGMLFS